MVSKLTKRALAASLKKLLAQKPLSKITIADITEDCGMNRMTFYYHFQDIYDLIDWICQEEGERAFQGRKGYNTWQEGFIALCHAVIENQASSLGFTVPSSGSKWKTTWAGWSIGCSSTWWRNCPSPIPSRSRTGRTLPTSTNMPLWGLCWTG